MDTQTRMKVLRNFANGAGVIGIAHTFRLRPEEVEAVLKSVGGRRDLASEEARRLRIDGASEEPAPGQPVDDDLLLAPQAEVSPSRAPHVLPRPQPEPVGSIGTLLTEATQAGGKLAATARKVHTLVDQLRRDMDGQREVLEAQRRVGEARAALDAAQARLKAVKSGEKPVAPTGRPAPRELRQWARANGIDCPPNGPMPRPVVEAWDAAHQEVAA